MNFIQYIDDSYSVKTRSVTVGESGYSVSGIDTPFFILSLYVDSRRQNGVAFNNYDSIEMLSVINDMSNVDLNVIPLNYFAPAYTEIQLFVNYSSSASAITVSNFADFQSKPFRFLKEYKLPQLRVDGRFGTSSAYSYDPRVYSLLVLGTLQGQKKFYVEGHFTYPNHTHLDVVDYQGDMLNYIPNGYPANYGMQENGGIVQYGDFYVKVTAGPGLSSYPYGLRFYLFTDVRTNEMWIQVGYIEMATSIVKRAEFDISTFVCVNGGFKIKSSLYDIEIQISNIYG